MIMAISLVLSLIMTIATLIATATLVFMATALVSTGASPGMSGTWIAIAGPLSNRSLVVPMITFTVFHLMFPEMCIRRIAVIIGHHHFISMIQIVVPVLTGEMCTVDPSASAEIDKHGGPDIIIGLHIGKVVILN